MNTPYADHEEGICPGYRGGCDHCDEERAAYIKSATRALPIRDGYSSVSTESAL